MSVDREPPSPEDIERMTKAAGIGPESGPTPGKKNIYVCGKCFGHIVTRDLVKGTTPFMVACRATEGCTGAMNSSFYRVWNQAIRASHEWYSPAPAERDGLRPATLHHVDAGGLLLRPIEAAP